MKVLHIIPSISKKRGGPSTAIINMVRSLRDEGIDAAILTTNDNHFYREVDWPLGHWFWIDNVPILMFPTINSASKLIREYLISPKLSWWLLKNIDQYDALHVHSIFSYTSTSSMLIARLKRVPYMVRTIGQLSSWSLTQSRIRKQLMLLFVEKNNLMKSFSIHVTSKSELDDVGLICNHKNILCLELGVELSALGDSSSQSHHQETHFVFLSRIHPKKQLEKLLEAFSLLQRRNHRRSWHLFIAGEGETEYVSSLKKLSREYAINDFIDWMGHISGKEKISLLSKSDWFVLPSISENFGISVVEALAYGVPVIISEEVGISDIVRETKAGIVCGSSVSLVDALTFALDGAPMEMRKAALKLARERFSWKEVAKKLSLFYTSQLRTRK